MKITHEFYTTSPELELAHGIVTIVRPLGPQEIDLREHGPAYLCRCAFGDFIAFHSELAFDDYVSAAEHTQHAAAGLGSARLD